MSWFRSCYLCVLFTWVFLMAAKAWIMSLPSQIPFVQLLDGIGKLSLLDLKGLALIIAAKTLLS